MLFLIRDNITLVWLLLWESRWEIITRSLIKSISAGHQHNPTNLLCAISTRRCINSKSALLQSGQRISSMNIFLLDAYTSISLIHKNTKYTIPVAQWTHYKTLGCLTKMHCTYFVSPAEYRVNCLMLRVYRLTWLKLCGIVSIKQGLSENDQWIRWIIKIKTDPDKLPYSVKLRQPVEQELILVCEDVRWYWFS